MRTLKIFISLLIVVLLTTQSVYAETEIGGSLKIDLRSLTKKTYCDFYNREDILTLKISSDLSDNVSIYGSLQGRYFDSPELTNFDSLKERDKVDPFIFDLWEAYIDISSFISEDLDIRIGKQIVEWGSADMLNPTSTLNPHDMSDPLDFSKRLPITMLNMNYYFPWEKVTSMQLIWIPSHKPALLPKSNMTMPMDIPIPADLQELQSSDGSFGSNPMSEKMDITINDPIELVDHKPFYPKNSEVGIRLTGNIFNTDFHFSYYNGYDEFPLPSKISAEISNEEEINNIISGALSGVDKTNSLAIISALNSIDKIPLNIESTIILAYPHYHIIGSDFKTDINGVGFWGEIGYYIPYEYNITYRYPDKDAMTSDDTIQNLIATEQLNIKYKETKIKYLTEPFVKYTLGAEYTFSGGWYFNAQFARGFFFERGETGLNDYLMLRFQKKCCSDLLLFSVFGGGSVEGGTLKYLITRFELPDDLATGFFGGPRIDYYPYDGITISIGAIFMGGKDSFFANMKDMEQVYFQAETSF